LAAIATEVILREGRKKN